MICVEREVKRLGRGVSFEPLPASILRVFEKRIKGSAGPHDSVQNIEPDLSRVDQKLLTSLLTFQREGVK